MKVFASKVLRDVIFTDAIGLKGKKQTKEYEMAKKHKIMEKFYMEEPIRKLRFRCKLNFDPDLVPDLSDSD